MALLGMGGVNIVTYVYMYTTSIVSGKMTTSSRIIVDVLDLPSTPHRLLASRFFSKGVREP